jgi:hypothetical protein
MPSSWMDAGACKRFPGSTSEDGGGENMCRRAHSAANAADAVCRVIHGSCTSRQSSLFLGAVARAPWPYHHGLALDSPLPHPRGQSQFAVPPNTALVARLQLMQIKVPPTTCCLNCCRQKPDVPGDSSGDSRSPFTPAFPAICCGGSLPPVCIHDDGPPLLPLLHTCCDNAG